MSRSAASKPPCGCGGRAPPLHQVWGLQLPPVLCVQLMRFNRTPGGWGKSRIPVVVPRSPWRPAAVEALADAGAGLWALRAVVRHHGRPDSGHYTAEVLRSGRWWHCDDDRVELVAGAGDREPDPDAYALIFQRLESA